MVRYLELIVIIAPNWPFYLFIFKQVVFLTEILHKICKAFGVLLLVAWSNTRDISNSGVLSFQLHSNYQIHISVFPRTKKGHKQNENMILARQGFII